MASTPSRYERTRCYRLGWAFERTGWGLMLAVSLAAVLGFFGNGWFGTAEAKADAGTARYARFARAHAPLDLVVEWLPQGREAELWIARDYLQRFEIEEVLPAPTATAADLGRVYYTFGARQPDAPIEARFRLKPRNAGRLSGEIGFDNGSTLVVRQIVFP